MGGYPSWMIYPDGKEAAKEPIVNRVNCMLKKMSRRSIFLKIAVEGVALQISSEIKIIAIKEH